MMRNRVGVILVLALVSGLLAAYLAFRFLRQPAVPGVIQASEAPTVQVVVANRDMNFGELITQQDIRMIDWPASVVPEGFASTPEEVVGRGLLMPLRLNEPFLSSKVASPEAGAGVPLGIDEGMRAMAVRVNDVIGVAGFVQPHQRVDVLVTLGEGAQVGEPITQVVLQDIQVLGIGQMTTTNDENQAVLVPVVTLLVDPDDAERLTHAEDRGKIRLALRNTLDRDTVETQGVRTRELITTRRVTTPAGARRVVPREPTGVSVEVYRGPAKSVEPVEGGGGGGS
jgi:pilus assembly protein CpaB